MTNKELHEAARRARTAGGVHRRISYKDKRYVTPWGEFTSVLAMANAYPGDAPGGARPRLSDDAIRNRADDGDAGTFGVRCRSGRTPLDLLTPSERRRYRRHLRRVRRG